MVVTWPVTLNEIFNGMTSVISSVSSSNLFRSSITAKITLSPAYNKFGRSDHPAKYAVFITLKSLTAMLGSSDTVRTTYNEQFVL